MSDCQYCASEQQISCTPEKIQEIQNIINVDEIQAGDFGVKLIKNQSGKLVCIEYYSEWGDLVKKIFYDKFTVSKIEHFRNELLYSKESFYEGHINKRIKYDKNGAELSSTNYRYNRDDKIIAISKVIDMVKYDITYGYDDFKRINSRTVKVNGSILSEQYYKYDILDRVVEYKDNNQTIKVDKINPKNELISYKIIDSHGKCINIKNKFLCSNYIGTEIETDGNKTVINDINFTNNIVLNKPNCGDGDIDFVMANIIPCSKQNNLLKTSRTTNTDITNCIIQNSMINKKCQLLPISRRKIRLLEELQSQSNIKTLFKSYNL